MRHFLITSGVTLFLTLLLQSIVDPVVFIVAQWEQDTLVNVLHFWFTFVSTYYLYNLALDKAYQRLVSVSNKLLVFVLLVTSIGALFYVLAIDILYYKMYYHVESLRETTFYEFDLPLAFAVLTIGNFYFYQQYFHQPIQRHSDNSKHSQTQNAFITINFGKETRVIQCATVAVFYASKSIVWLQLLSGEVFHTTMPLSKLLEDLDDQLFLRINRQTIVSRYAVQGFRKLPYQKLEVTLVLEIKEVVNLVVSKYNAQHFKSWLTNSAKK